LIASRQRWGRWTAFSGLLVLITGLVLSFRATEDVRLVLVMYATLIAGMLLSSIGIYLADKWIQPPRADQALANALKGFDKRYRLYNYLLPAPHVLLSPYGLTVFTVKRHGDTVRYANGRWKHEQSLFRKFQSLSRERLGDPVQQLEWEKSAMEELIAKHFPDAEVPIHGVIVFTHPDVVLQLDGVPVDVIHVKKLKSYMRRLHRQASQINGGLLRQLGELLDEMAREQEAAFRGA
jgi:hypothetical protein